MTNKPTTTATPRTAGSRLSTLVVFAAGAVLLSTSLNAATFYQTVDQLSGTTGNNWDAALWGDPAASAVSGNDYISENMTLRTSNSGSGITFKGDTLTMINSTLIFKRNSIANYILDGATFNAVGSKTIGGTILLAAGKTATLQSAFNLTATLSGSGIFTKIDSGALTVDNATNTFTGTWNVTAGTLTSTTAGSFDTTANFTVSGGTLDLGYAFNNAATTLDLSGTGTFDLSNGFNYTFGSVSIAGSSLAAGTYSFGDLSTGQQAYFVSGTDSFTVIPEPSTFALLGGIGTLLFVGSQRRRKSAAATI